MTNRCYAYGVSAAHGVVFLLRSLRSTVVTRPQYILIGLLWLLCLSPTPAFAQYVTVTGTVRDVNGLPYSGGRVTAQLVFAGTPVSNPTVQISTLSVCRANGFGVAPCQVPIPGFNGPFSLDLSGNLPGGGITLPDNTLILPAGTTWLFSVSTTGVVPPLGTGPQVCTANISISGAAQSVSGNFASCPALSSPGIGGSSGVAKGTVDPTAAPYNAKFDVHWGTKPTFNNGSNIVACVDCNFTSTDSQGRPYAVVGQIVWGTNATNDVSTGLSTLTTPECVIQSVDSNTQIHMGTIGSIATPCNAIATTVVSGYLLWGDLDSASSTQTQSTSNDPLFAAWTAASNSCAPLSLPAGFTFVEQAEFVTYPTTQTCGSNNSLTSMRFGFTLKGVGPFATYIIPTPNFLASTCTGPNGTGNACLIALPNPFIRDLQIFGGGNSACGAGFNGKTLSQIVGINPGINMRVQNVMMFGWCGNTAGSKGLTIGNGGGTTISGGDLYDTWIETYGAGSVVSDPGTTGIIAWHGGDYYSNGTALEVKSGTFKSTLGFHGTGGPGTFTAQLDANTQYYSTDEEIQQAGGNSDFVHFSGTGAIAHIKGAHGPNIGGNLLGRCTGAITCTMYMSDSVGAVGQGTVFSDTGSTFNFFDNGANTLKGITSLGVLNWGGPGNGDGVIASCSGLATASSTLGMYGTGPNVTLTSCTSAAIGSGIVMQNSGTLIQLIVSASVGGVNASSGVVTVRLNGALQTQTCTLGTTTNCNDGAHPISYVKGDLVSLQFTTQAADTLQGLKARIVAN